MTSFLQTFLSEGFYQSVQQNYIHGYAFLTNIFCIPTLPIILVFHQFFVLKSCQKASVVSLSAMRCVHVQLKCLPNT